MSSTSSQASVSTSLSPQPSSTNHSNNNNGPLMGGIFTMNGSPTLVVAFLAIGLFTVTMAALFGWKRMHRGRLMVHPVRPAPRPGKKPVVLGEKPALWEMWTRREEGVMIDTRWENITPFCATLFCPIEELVLTKNVEPRLRNSSHSSFTMRSAIRQYFRPTPNPTPPPPPEPPAHELDYMSERPGSSALLLTQGSSVVMSFTIAMPSPRKCDTAASSQASDPGSTPELFHDTELGEYCIGSMEVSCSKDG
ncbi:uncharacterized protein EDB91DRAFT_1077316 [Suillus paluster]|uniref:uncharacterized protein n=1 Tax=Suillus paluster TaxID=48578 RepID=UPI001B85D643|nr:uncharacterized protein EDB91DRAFT_1077316 [Suillus paluster]KAG1753573.1 hypothetical protein EDB91DRAFT_1077316 [Suillus paluster]